jgi:hypothetical protein
MGLPVLSTEAGVAAVTWVFMAVAVAVDSRAEMKARTTMQQGLTELQCTLELGDQGS